MKKPRQHFGRKRKPIGYIFLPGPQLCEAKGCLNLRSCLYYSIIYSYPRIGKYINKHELHQQCPPIRAKYTKMNDIDNSSYVRNIMTVTPVFKI